ncbi:uncharacterized protein LOC118484801 [Helianthus annuus]|uniref:uncharacterized protein LOC118484801 n=1 Tax=Helianthus annuus TaxID=4232 RepID=UPI001653139D|nr:uncharacterized protein LOC118484801 [Helianthus annuus]
MSHIHGSQCSPWKVLAWIGVKRPMQFLHNTIAITRVPNPFRIRAFSAPVGQAVISTSIEVINSIKAAGWWDNIKQKVYCHTTTCNHRSPSSLRWFPFKDSDR